MDAAMLCVKTEPIVDSYFAGSRYPVSDCGGSADFLKKTVHVAKGGDVDVRKGGAEQPRQGAAAAPYPHDRDGHLVRSGWPFCAAAPNIADCKK